MVKHRQQNLRQCVDGNKECMHLIQQLVVLVPVFVHIPSSFSLHCIVVQCSGHFDSYFLYLFSASICTRGLGGTGNITIQTEL